MAKAKSIETAFEELEEIITAMESPQTSLEESFKLFNAGMKLVGYCNSSLDKVEKKLIQVGEEEQS